MKYFEIYRDVMQEYIVKIDTMQTLGLRKQRSWAVMAVALRFPNDSLTVLYKHLEQDYGINMDEKSIIYALKDIRLNSPVLREEMLTLVQETVGNIKKMLDGDIKACKSVGEFLKTKVSGRNERGRSTFNAKAVITYMAMIDKEFSDASYKAVAENYMEIFSGRIIKEIYKRSASALGLSIECEQQDAKQVIAHTQAVLEASNVENYYDLTEDKDKQIEHLQFEVDNLKNALEMMEAMFEDLKESVDEVSKEAKTTAISSFFLKLNSSEYGNILDSLPVVEENLKSLKKQRIQLPPLAMALPIIFKQLIKFIKDVGIEPIDTLGREFLASYDDIALINYIGSPYIEDGEVKKVSVTGQGWKYGDIIISNPTVTEKG